MAKPHHGGFAKNVLPCTCVVVLAVVEGLISWVSDQNGISLLFIILEIYHSGRKTLICISSYVDQSEL